MKKQQKSIAQQLLSFAIALLVAPSLFLLPACEEKISVVPHQPDIVQPLIGAFNVIDQCGFGAERTYVMTIRRINQESNKVVLTHFAGLDANVYGTLVSEEELFIADQILKVGHQTIELSEGQGVPSTTGLVINYAIKRGDGQSTHCEIVGTRK